MSESLAAFRYYGWALHDAMPRVFRSLEARLCRVLDLSFPDEAEHISVWMAQIRSEDWRAQQGARRESTSQAIGRAAWTTGLEGLLVPSFTSPGKTNLVAFPGSFAPGSSVRVVR
jgi:RES domain-containing protein